MAVDREVATRMPMLRTLASLLLALPLLAGGSGKRVLHPTKAERPPVIDGVLDDPIWQNAASVTDFDTFIPEFGKRQPEKTVAYMAYDHDNLYFAFRCFDPHPELIKAHLSRRDDVAADDFICINLDTFDDQQALYAFYVNPLGIQGDSRFAANKEDFSIDLVWESAGRIDAEGYTVEVKIPLKSIRYTSDDVVHMGVLLERFISRRQEHGSYPSLDPKAGYAFMPQLAPLEYPGLARASVMELLPAFTFTRRHEREGADFVRLPDKTTWSLTAKAGLGSSLVLDATLHPDFSQVESDAGQVDANLRYALYFPEKRPFFLEGSELFNVGATSNSPLLEILHTRSIVDPSSGVKLTGKLGPADSISVLHVEDQAPPPDPGLPPLRDPDVSALRYKHALSADGYVGLFGIDRNQGLRHNRVGGLDGQLRLTPSDQLSFHGFEAATRPGDGTADSNGQASGLELQHDTSTLGFNAGAHSISSTFVADTSYLTRTGFTNGFLNVTPKFYPTESWIRRVDLTAGASALRDYPSDLTEQDRSLAIAAILQSNGALAAQYDDSTEIFLGQRFTTSGLTLTARNQMTTWFSFTAKERIGKGIWYSATPLQGHGAQTTLQVVLQPTASLNATLSWTRSTLFRDDTGEELLNYPISRLRLIWQPTDRFFLRAITEYNGFRRQLLTDFLASYTYVPGTVVYLGYGSLYERTQWDGTAYRPADHLLEMQRGLFFKASYLYRF